MIESETAYRHEYKYPLTKGEVLFMKQRLAHVMRSDGYATDGVYEIRSLYFDTASNRALMEKLEGTNPRAKYRIRIYNRCDDVIKLEKKVKCRDLTQKTQVTLTRMECDRILAGDIAWMLHDERSLLVELYAGMRTDGLVPRTLVEYTRMPFVYDAGNVRVTLDCDIRTGVFSKNLFSPQSLVPTGSLKVLEVKYDRFLPDLIRGLLSPVARNRQSFSKYEVCRKFG